MLMNSSVSDSFLSVETVLSILTGTIALTLYLLNKKHKKLVRGILIGFAIGFMTNPQPGSLSPELQTTFGNEVVKNNPFIIKESSNIIANGGDVWLRVSPNKDSVGILVIFEGQDAVYRYSLVDTTGNLWHFIEYNGQCGWVYARWTKLL